MKDQNAEVERKLRKLGERLRDGLVSRQNEEALKTFSAHKTFSALMESLKAREAEDRENVLKVLQEQLKNTRPSEGGPVPNPEEKRERDKH